MIYSVKPFKIDSPEINEHIHVTNDFLPPNQAI